MPSPSAIFSAQHETCCANNRHSPFLAGSSGCGVSNALVKLLDLFARLRPELFVDREVREWYASDEFALAEEKVIDGEIDAKVKEGAIGCRMSTTFLCRGQPELSGARMRDNGMSHSNVPPHELFAVGAISAVGKTFEFPDQMGLQRCRISIL